MGNAILEEFHAACPRPPHLHQRERRGSPTVFHVVRFHAPDASAFVVGKSEYLLNVHVFWYPLPVFQPHDLTADNSLNHVDLVFRRTLPLRLSVLATSGYTTLSVDMVKFRGEGGYAYETLSRGIHATGRLIAQTHAVTRSDNARSVQRFEPSKVSVDLLRLVASVSEYPRFRRRDLAFHLHKIEGRTLHACA